MVKPPLRLARTDAVADALDRTALKLVERIAALDPSAPLLRQLAGVSALDRADPQGLGIAIFAPRLLAHGRAEERATLTLKLCSCCNVVTQHRLQKSMRHSGHLYFGLMAGDLATAGRASRRRSRGGRAQRPEKQRDEAIMSTLTYSQDTLAAAAIGAEAGARKPLWASDG
jgi:hypothetical protein